MSIRRLLDQYQGKRRVMHLLRLSKITEARREYQRSFDPRSVVMDEFADKDGEFAEGPLLVQHPQQKREPFGSFRDLTFESHEPRTVDDTGGA
jgi:hypothetical protein